MDLIVAGTFEQSRDADNAVNALLAKGLLRDAVCMFALNPPGQHAALSMGGDHHSSPGATHAGMAAVTGAGIGAAVGLGIGAATAPVTGPAGPIGGAAVGAYVGSLAGALNGMQDAGAKPDSVDGVAVRPAGILVAVNASDSTDEAMAIDIMREAGAREIERALGTWRDGTWTDFDPASPPQLVGETV